MREKQIENKLATETKKLGGIALKFVSPSFDGMPDRLVLIPDGHIAFVELKTPGMSKCRRSIQKNTTGHKRDCPCSAGNTQGRFFQRPRG